MTLLFLFLSLFRETALECSICGWPNVATVNQRGQCVVGLGLQSNLKSSCALWCNTWGNSVSGQTSSNHVVSSSDDGECVCQRLSIYSVTEYKTRPQRTCSNLGPSDDVINSWKNPISTPIVTTNPNYGGYTDWQDNYTPDQNSLISMYYMNDYQPSSKSTYASGMFGEYYGGINIDFTPITGTVFGLTRASFQGLYQHQVRIYDSIVNRLNFRFDSTQNQFRKIDSSISIVDAKLAGILTNASLDAAKQDLIYAINSRVGGSSPVDFSGIYSALSLARDANLQATKDVGDSISAFSGRVSASLSSLKSSVDVLNSNVNSIGDSVSALGHNINYMGKMIDSGSNARWLLDKAYRDSMSAFDSNSASSIYDSLKRANSSSWSSDSSSIFNSSISSIKTSSDNISNEIDKLKSDLISGGCSEFPVWSVFVMGTNIDLGSGFNAYPEIFTLLRFLCRFFGAFLGFKTIAAVLGARKEE